MPLPDRGVLRYCKIAIATLSLSKDPSELVLSYIIRLEALTPSSALPLDCANSTEETRCLMTHTFKNCLNSLDVNAGPPSEQISSGAPYDTNIERDKDIKCLVSDGI